MKKVKRKSAPSDSRQGFRRLGVMVEAVHHDVKLVAEQHGSIRKTLDEHTRTLHIHTEMIGNLAVDMEIVKGDIQVMKGDIEFIKIDLKKKVDIDEFAALERRVAALEKRK